MLQIIGKHIAFQSSASDLYTYTFSIGLNSIISAIASSNCEWYHDW